MISDRIHRLFCKDIIGGNSEGISQKIDRVIPGELSERISVWISTGTFGGYPSRTTEKNNPRIFGGVQIPNDIPSRMERIPAQDCERIHARISDVNLEKRTEQIAERIPGRIFG